MGGLWAAAADLDAVTAIPWVFLGPQTPLSADSLMLMERLLGHRGLSHTFLLGVLLAVAAWGITRRSRWGAIVGIAWVSHVAFDVFTVWTAVPFWPFSDAGYRYPLVTTVDPVLTIVSLLAIGALLGPLLVERYGWGGRGWGSWLRDQGHRWGRTLAVASLGVVLLSVAWLGAVSTVQGVPFGDTHSAHLPRTVTLIEHEEEWEIQERWTPFSEGDSRFVAKRDNQTVTGDGEGSIAAAECALSGLGPYNHVDEPVFLARPGGEVTLVEVHDIVRNATGGGPVMLFSVGDGGVVEQAWSSGEEPNSFYRIPIPQPVVEEARCR